MIDLLAPLAGPLLHPLLASAGAALAGRFALSSLAPQALAAKALAVILCALLCAYGGWRLKAAFDAQEKVAELNAAIALRDINARLVTRIETKYVDRIIEIQTRGVDITREVPIYVTKKADAGCVITRGFVELHDAAAAMRPPQRPADPDAPAAGVALSAVADTVAGNYAACAVAAEQVKGWQEFYMCLKAGGKGCG